MAHPKFLSILIAGVFLLSGSTASGADSGFGKLAERQGKELVWKTPPEQSTSEMKRGDDVVNKLHAETGEESGARFTIRKEGSVLMGSKSRFTFKNALFGPTGLLRELDLGIQWGIFRFSFVPTPLTPPKPDKAENREVRIKVSPTLGAEGPEIQLYGTDVYVEVEGEKGEIGATTVYVAEGAAAVTGSGETVRVEAGHWTYVPWGKPPLSPRPLDPELWLGGGRPPDDWQLSGPLWIDLFRRLDVPH